MSSASTSTAAASEGEPPPAAPTGGASAPAPRGTAARCAAATAGSVSSVHRPCPIRSGVQSCCINSGTTSRSAKRLDRRRMRTETRRRTITAVIGLTPLATSIGTPAMASSNVAVPDLVSAAAEAANASYLSAGLDQDWLRRPLCAPRRTAPSLARPPAPPAPIPAAVATAAPKTAAIATTSVRRLPGITVNTRLPRRFRGWRGTVRHRRDPRHSPAPDGRRTSQAGHGARRTPVQRQQAEQLVPQTGVMPHAAFAPGPYLRCDVVDALQGREYRLHAARAG